jgi:acyl-CoA thioesterase-1
MAAACGGGSGSDPVPAPPPGGNVPAPPSPPDATPPPGAPPATVVNSVAQVKSDASGSHEAIPVGLTTVGPTPGQKAPPQGTVALGGYGQVFIAGDNAASNSRVQLRNFETYVLTKASAAVSPGKWKRVQYSERVEGGSYTVNYGAPGLAAAVRNEPSGGISVKPAAGTLYRFWPESGLMQSIVPLRDIEAVFSTVQTKLIIDSSTAADDRSRARMVVSTAADWLPSLGMYNSGAPSPAEILAGTPLGVGKLRLVKNDWQAINFHSATSGQVDALDVAQETGGTAPLANSKQRAVAAKRVIIIGDSITEGSSGRQDSFRRPLWNSIVSDAGNFLIDFVGTRQGVQSVGSTCGSIEPLSGGGPRVPEFDQDHEAYWGWCVDDVNDVLQSRLRLLAADDRRPDIAVVHLGTNDVYQLARAPSAVRGELATTIATLRSDNPKIRILLAKLIPLSSGDAVLDAQIGVLNDEIAALAVATTTIASPITVVDQFTGFSNTNGVDRYDGVHPNDAGEAKMAAKWLPALKEALK